MLSPVGSAGLIIEADTIITHHADELFGIVRRHSHRFPLMPAHPDERLPSCYGYQGSRMCINTLAYPVAKRTIPYSHAHLCFSGESKAFLGRALARCVACSGNSCDSMNSMCGNDEHALNFLLWEEGANKLLCLMDPTFTIISNLERGFLDNSGLEMAAYLGRRGFAVSYVHGNKDPANAKDIVGRLRTTKSRK